MEFRRFDIEGPVLITPKRHGDARGIFSEVFRQDLFSREIGDFAFVQDNHSRSEKRGTLRGLHFQAPPSEQGKLVRVTRGAVFDVAIDIRRASPSYGRHVAVELSAENWAQLWVPPGFLHGFLTLTADTEFLYKVTAPYDAAREGAIRWDDPDLAIAWPLGKEAITLSPRDAAAPAFRDLPAIF